MLDLSRERLLILAPHPDDEIFGCGGLIYKVKKAGGQVFVIFMTVGTTKDFSATGFSTTDERQREIELVMRAMGVDAYRVAFAPEYHLRLDSLALGDIINEIERGPNISLQTIHPTMLAIPTKNDYNQDHRVVHDAAIAATRPVPGIYKHNPSMILEYEFPYFGYGVEGTQEQPNFFVALDDEAFRMKHYALSLYKSQLKVEKGPVSLHGSEILARMRGIHSGTDAAEAFIVRRLVA